MTQTQKEERYPNEDISTAKDMTYIILHKIPHEWARRGSRNEYVLPSGEYVWITNPKSDDMRCYGFVKRIEITFTCRSLRTVGNTAEIARETGTSIIKQSSAKAGRRTIVASAQKKSVAGRDQNAATALLWKQIRSSVGPSTTGTKRLIQNGADPNAKNENGETMLFVVLKKIVTASSPSLEKNRAGTAAVLKTAGAKLAGSEEEKIRELASAKPVKILPQPAIHTRGKDDVVTLLRYGANPNAKGFNDKSLLLFALEKGANTSKTSCPAGFDFGIEDKFGRNVFFFLTDRCDESVIEMFKDSGADINKRAVFALSGEDIFNRLKDAGFANDGTDLAAYKKR